MELTYEEVENYLLRIFTGKEITDIDCGSKKVIVMFKQPNMETKLRANLIYDKAYKKALDEGLYTVSDLEKLLEKRGLYTEEDVAQVEKLQSKLKAQETLLSKTTKVKANSDRIKKVISKIKSQISEIEYKKNSHLMMAAETKAEEERRNFLCSNCAYDETGTNLYWSNVEEFVLDNNYELRLKTLTAFLKFYYGIDMKTMRYIARHNLWRIRYIHSQKVSEPLFGIPTVDYSNDQLNLIYWSNYYSNIYEMMPEDRPPDSVIEDDEALDAYMIEFYNEKSKEAASKRSNKKNKGDMSAFEKEEVIVTQSNELYHDISYDKPKEAQKIKDRSDVKKRTRKS